ncbi:S8 family serine peptidase [Reyranella sp.]|uniref:S8 family peptidase n=1 Tax=Reyranella sp. TaxID=1929291 RepID=UPI003D1381F1
MASKKTKSAKSTRAKAAGPDRTPGASFKGPKRDEPAFAKPSMLRLMDIGAKAAAPKAIGAKAANTVIYIHGIGNKPIASILKCQWDTALFGTELGDRSRMAYWVNRQFYPEPLKASCASGDKVALEDEEATTRAILGITGEQGGDEQVLSREIGVLAKGDQQRAAFLRSIANTMTQKAETAQAAFAAQDVAAKILPLPAFLRRLITRSLTRVLLRDVNDFLFDGERRDSMEKSLLDRLMAGGGPFVIIAHSQGSMIAYDVLRRLQKEQIEVPLFLTIGSPLGIAEVQDVIRQWTGGGLPFPPCVERWVNIADRLDPVAIDSTLANDFGADIEDRQVVNLDSPRHPHSGTGYLQTKLLRDVVRETVGTGFQQAIAPFAIAKDLVADLEDGLRDKRHEVLIQLSDAPGTAPADRLTHAKAVEQVSERIKDIVTASGAKPDDARIEPLRHFVAAELTRLEVEALRSHYADLQMKGVWRNAVKRTLINQSTHTVQARPANIGYGADGKGIAWAILDTGIRADHPHFAEYQNVIEQWDCTRTGAPSRLTPGMPGFDVLDGNGHGTHVAATVAGMMKIGNAKDSVVLAGMAPRTSLYGFKVLADDGTGRDSWIIKALDKIAEINEASSRLQIQGVNLSLGGGFDPSVFGCGHTPLCEELRRLWRQGVIVCLAAGNEGYAVLSSANGDIQANLDLSIGDPANLDEAIAVGSVHKTNPHTYGISYFSSRGPTADGRQKPDVVAPGENIVSARHDWKEALAAGAGAITIDNHYVEMSGTSMATPHVSGLLAAFLSLRREFIGYPDRVKKMLLDGCVDLKRDPNMQGSGLPNLIKMLALN